MICKQHTILALENNYTRAYILYTYTGVHIHNNIYTRQEQRRKLFTILGGIISPLGDRGNALTERPLQS